MYISVLRKLWLALGLGLGLVVGFGACSNNVPPAPVMGTQVSALYAAPSTYQDHRDQQRQFQSSTGNIAFTDNGSGPVLVLLHGVPTSSWMYRKIIPDLQKSMRVISVDHLGFGSSDKPNSDTGYTPADHANRVQELLTSLDITQYSILMHDMGGLVAWEMLRADQDAVDNLVVLNTIVHDDGFKQPDMKPGAFTRTLMDAYSSPLTSVAVLNKTFSDLGLKGAHRLTEAECFGYVLPMREGADPALYQFFTSINKDLLAKLDENRTAFSNYQGQTLVLWGEKDETLTAKQIPILQETLNIPDKNIHLYADNAHFLAEEIPSEIVSKVTALMAR